MHINKRERNKGFDKDNIISLYVSDQKLKEMLMWSVEIQNEKKLKNTIKLFNKRRLFLSETEIKSLEMRFVNDRINKFIVLKEEKSLPVYIKNDLNLLSILAENKIFIQVNALRMRNLYQQKKQENRMFDLCNVWTNGLFFAEHMKKIDIDEVIDKYCTLLEKTSLDNLLSQKNLSLNSSKKSRI